jgi:hypothetical protein
MSQNLAEEESTKVPFWHSNFSQAFFIKKTQIMKKSFLGTKLVTQQCYPNAQKLPSGLVEL